MRGFAFLMIVIGVAVGGILPATTEPPARPAEAATPRVDTARATASYNPVETLLERENNGHFFAFADVNGEPVRFVIDTGASMVALTEEDARRAHVSFSPGMYEVIGSGASGPVRGQMVKLNDVVLDGKRFPDITGAVVEGLDVSLLGQSYLGRLQTIEIRGDTMRLR